MLLALLTGQRRQTLYALDIHFMQLTTDKSIFSIITVLKISRVGHHLNPLKLLAFEPNSALGIVKHLGCDVDWTKPLRGSQSRLIICYQKPYKVVSRDTI